MNYAWDISQSETEKYFERIELHLLVMFLERKKANKLAHVISMIHSSRPISVGEKKRSVIVENGVYSMEIY